VRRELKAADGDGWTLVAGDARRGALLQYEGSSSVQVENGIPIASATKWLTSTLLLRLVQDKVLDLDDRVSRWLPAWSVGAFDGATHHTLSLHTHVRLLAGIATGDDRDGQHDMRQLVTLRHLLSMTSGIEQGVSACDWAMRGSGAAPSGLAPLSACVIRIASNSPQLVTSMPGTVLNYEGFNLEIAGAMAESATHQSFSMLFSRLVQPRLKAPAVYVAAQSHYGPMASGLIISTGDYAARLLPFILRPAGALLSNASLRSMQYNASGAAVNATLSPAPEFAGFRYGLGVWLEENGTIASSMGAGGFYPRIHIESGAYVVLVPGAALQRELPYAIASGSLMVRSVQLMKSLWPALLRAIAEAPDAPPPLQSPRNQYAATAEVAARAQAMQLDVAACGNGVRVRVEVHHDFATFAKSKPAVLGNGSALVHAYADSLIASVPPALALLVATTEADATAFRLTARASPILWLKLNRACKSPSVVSAAAVNAATASAAIAFAGKLMFEDLMILCERGSQDETLPLGPAWLAAAVSLRRQDGNTTVIVRCPAAMYDGSVFMKVLSRQAILSSASL